MKALILLLSLFSMQALAANGSLVFTKGNVQINGKDAPMKSSISFGDEVFVGEKSLAVVKLMTGSLLKIKPNSKLVIEKPKKLKKETKMYSFLLKFGEVFVKAKKTKKLKYQVKAKDVIMGVRGTKFFVTSDKDEKNVWMCVNEGKVAVAFEKDLNKLVEVKAGEGVLVDSNKLPEVKKYKWTKDLNWKFEGTFEDMEDKIDIRQVGYDIESFEYD